MDKQRLGLYGFEVKPDAPNAAEEWNNFYRTFINTLHQHNKENYIRRQQQGDEEQDWNEKEEEEREEKRELFQPEQRPRKLQTLINYISPDIYEYISEAEDYYSAINILDRLYTKPNSILYNRNQLVTRKQEKDESVYEYMHRLEKLSNDCMFEAVSAEVHRQEVVRETFINGLTSMKIHHQLLDNSNLTLKQVLKQAQELELAQNDPEAARLLVAPEPVEDIDSEEYSSRYKTNCFFCGMPRPHHRIMCYLRPHVTAQVDDGNGDADGDERESGSSDLVLDVLDEHVFTATVQHESGLSGKKASESIDKVESGQVDQHVSAINESWELIDHYVPESLDIYASQTRHQYGHGAMNQYVLEPTDQNASNVIDEQLYENTNKEQVSRSVDERVSELINNTNKEQVSRSVDERVSELINKHSSGPLDEHVVSVPIHQSNSLNKHSSGPLDEHVVSEPIHQSNSLEDDVFVSQPQNDEHASITINQNESVFFPIGQHASGPTLEYESDEPVDDVSGPMTQQHLSLLMDRLSSIDDELSSIDDDVPAFRFHSESEALNQHEHDA